MPTTIQVEPPVDPDLHQAEPHGGSASPNLVALLKDLLADAKQDAHRNGLTDGEIDAEIEALRSERSG